MPARKKGKGQKARKAGTRHLKHIYIAKGPWASIQQSLKYTPRVELRKFNKFCPERLKQKGNVMASRQLRWGQRMAGRRSCRCRLVERTAGWSPPSCLQQQSAHSSMDLCLRHGRAGAGHPLRPPARPLRCPRPPFPPLHRWSRSSYLFRLPFCLLVSPCAFYVLASFLAKNLLLWIHLKCSTWINFDPYALALKPQLA